jgi:hypothetical protein
MRAMPLVISRLFFTASYSTLGTRSIRAALSNSHEPFDLRRHAHEP